MASKGLGLSDLMGGGNGSFKKMSVSKKDASGASETITVESPTPNDVGPGLSALMQGGAAVQSMQASPTASVPFVPPPTGDDGANMLLSQLVTAGVPGPGPTTAEPFTREAVTPTFPSPEMAPGGAAISSPDAEFVASTSGDPYTARETGMAKGRATPPPRPQGELPTASSPPVQSEIEQTTKVLVDAPPLLTDEERLQRTSAMVGGITNQVTSYVESWAAANQMRMDDEMKRAWSARIEAFQPLLEEYDRQYLDQMDTLNGMLSDTSGVWSWLQPSGQRLEIVRAQALLTENHFALKRSLVAAMLGGMGVEQDVGVDYPGGSAMTQLAAQLVPSASEALDVAYRSQAMQLAAAENVRAGQRHGQAMMEGEQTLRANELALQAAGGEQALTETLDRLQQIIRGGKGSMDEELTRIESLPPGEREMAAANLYLQLVPPTPVETGNVTSGMIGALESQTDSMNQVIPGRTVNQALLNIDHLSTDRSQPERIREAPWASLLEGVLSAAQLANYPEEAVQELINEVEQLRNIYESPDNPGESMRALFYDWVGSRHPDLARVMRGSP